MSSARCKVSGCRRKAHARGFCQKHYDEQRKSRSRQAGPRPAARPSSGRLPRVAPPPKPVVVPEGDESMASKLCCVPGCANPHHAKGYCKSHYGQLRRRGSIEDMPGAAAAAPLLSREQRLIEIKKRHEFLKREIASIHKALESETGDDSP